MLYSDTFTLNYKDDIWYCLVLKCFKQFFFLFVQFGTFNIGSEEYIVQTPENKTDTTLKSGVNQFEIKKEKIPEIKFNDFLEKGEINYFKEFYSEQNHKRCKEKIHQISRKKEDV